MACSAEDLVPRLLSLNPDAASELEASVAKPPPNGGQRSLQQNAGWGRRFGAWRLAPGLRDPIDSGSVAKSWRDSGSKPNLAGAADTTSSADNASPTMDSRHKHRWVWNRVSHISSCPEGLLCYPTFCSTSTANETIKIIITLADS